MMYLIDLDKVEVYIWAHYLEVVKRSALQFIRVHPHVVKLLQERDA